MAGEKAATAKKKPALTKPELARKKEFRALMAKRHLDVRTVADYISRVTEEEVNTLRVRRWHMIDDPYATPVPGWVVLLMKLGMQRSDVDLAATLDESIADAKRRRPGRPARSAS